MSTIVKTIRFVESVLVGPSNSMDAINMTPEGEPGHDRRHCACVKRVEVDYEKRVATIYVLKPVENILEVPFERCRSWQLMPAPKAKVAPVEPPKQKPLSGDAAAKAAQV